MSRNQKRIRHRARAGLFAAMLVFGTPGLHAQESGDDATDTAREELEVTPVAPNGETASDDTIGLSEGETPPEAPDGGANVASDEESDASSDPPASGDGAPAPAVSDEVEGDATAQTAAETVVKPDADDDATPTQPAPPPPPAATSPSAPAVPPVTPVPEAPSSPDAGTHSIAMPEPPPPQATRDEAVRKPSRYGTLYDHQAPHVRISAALASLRTNDPGYALVDQDNDVLRGGSVLGGVHFGDGWALDLEYTRASSNARTFAAAVKNEFRQQRLALRGTWSFVDLPVAAPYATATAGAAWARFEVDDFAARYVDRAAAFTWSAAVGVEISSPGSVFVGLYTDVGYQWQGELSFDDASSGEFGGRVVLGGLEMRGLAWRWGLRLGARL